MITETRTEKNPKDITIVFDGVTDVLEYIKHVDAENHSVNYRDTYFCKFSWETAIELFRNGWKDGVNEIQNIQDKIESKLESSEQKSKFDVDYDVAGDFIDMGRVMTGEPECFGFVAPQQKETIKIQVNITYNANIEQDTVYRRGAAITTVIEKLRERYHVVIEFIERANYSGNYETEFFTTILRVDTTNDFSRDTVAFCTANSAYLRRIGFAINEVALGYKSCGGYGHTEDIKPDANALYFPAIMTNNGPWATTETTTREINRILADFDKKQNTKKGA